MGHVDSSTRNVYMKTHEEHLIAFQNSLTRNEDCRYVLTQVLVMLNYFDVCETEGDVARRNAAIELLENCGIVFQSNAMPEFAEASALNFVEVISKLDVSPLVEAQERKQKEIEDEKTKL